MEAKIHPTAIIESGAQLEEGVIVGAYAYIGAQVKIASGTEVMHHATVDGDTTLGNDNEIHPYAYIGGKTHDLKYKDGIHRLKIGSHNVFREYSTVHCATAEDLLTEMGDHNVILAYSHIAHECKVGHHLVMSSHAALGGHVEVGDHVNVGWGVGIHQFCRLGDYCMAAATATVLQDIPPFFTASGNPAEVRGINKVGLQRAGFTEEAMSGVRKAYKQLYKKGLNRSQAIESIVDSELSQIKEVDTLVAFIKASERGIA
ncbi:MAG: acyl-ACP--UDP-N-acetylglucosamine O-acyltransferase [Coraliomargaritaceae bacterium]